jgi:hypothetical protein
MTSNFFPFFKLFANTIERLLSNVLECLTECGIVVLWNASDGTSKVDEIGY